ncbi:esterase [Mycolicibacterium parafortuitum]|uniref:Esterase n=1 Tax=Mycolicibacterium parafortuitum TaxID=39692 RepID=A0A7I7U9I4_MYCPF|nr:serine hydrolase domain-containing protein [Mycolicibacterium parafortuitum]PQE02138.1 esterase [Mycobacterium sp. EPG1]BBY77553.1 esterase [Mycolicibacterium parafortuitum]
MTGVNSRERDEALSHGHGGHLPRGVQGAADPNFTLAVRAFAQMFPHRRFGGGALSVYLDGEPVVDVWTGWADRKGKRRWTADTAPMVFSATKGVAATVIHRLADRGLIDYDAPVAEYWREFGVNGKATITVRELMRHRAGLSQLNGAAKTDLMDHLVMEERLAAAPASWLVGKPAYHAFTFGWLLSGLARSVTGVGMRELIRTEVAAPLNTDGIHLGRPPVQAPTQPARIIGPQTRLQNPLFNMVAPHIAALPFSAGFGAIYFPGVKSFVQGDTPLLDGEIPAANGVATARALARMYGAIANEGRIDGRQYLSRDTATRLIGRRSLRLDHSMVMPLSFHLGYHGLPIPGVLPGFGHVGLGGSLGWADPDTGLAFGFVHNRLLTPFVVSDQAGFVATAGLIRLGAASARRNGYRRVREYGAPFTDVTATAV